MEYEKFDVKRALAGEPVILRNGLKAFIRHKEEELNVSRSLSGIAAPEEHSPFYTLWRLDGNCLQDRESSHDIVGMYPEEPLTMPDSFWKLLTPGTVAITKNRGGTWFGLDAIPEYYDKSFLEGWVWEEDCMVNNCVLSGFNPELFPDCKPEDSLILRPKEK